jgi:Skp family chaperone for outer membrane proteins
MLRGNLSTRPFYNERIVTLVIGIVGLAALALAAFNVSQVVALSHRRSELSSKVSRDVDETRKIQKETEALRRTADPITLKNLAASTREANTLIDQRTFSWTVFFGLIEKKLPLDARLVAVAPKIDKGSTTVTMLVVAKSQTDIAALDDALQSDGTFYDVTPGSLQQNDDGTLNATIFATYNPPAGAPKPPKTSGRERP